MNYNEFIYRFRWNNYIYLLFLIPLFLSQNTKVKLFIEPYITIIYTGNGLLSTINELSSIKPSRIYFTETGQIINAEGDDYKININNNIQENNITLEFKATDKKLDFLFKGLNNIKKVDLSHFKVKVEDTSYMFCECYILEDIIFGNFDTSLVTNMTGMFKNTQTIKSIDLSGFNTKNVLDMNNMFSNCNALKYLNIKNFDFSKITNKDNINQILFQCNNLIYLNIQSLKISNEYYDEIFKNVNNNLIYCLNEQESSELLNYLENSNKNYIINCSYLTQDKSVKVLITIMDTYFNSKPLTDINDYSTIPKIVEKSNSINYLNCSSEDLLKRKCGNTKMTIENKDYIINNLVNDIINGTLNPLIDDIINGNKDDYITVEDDVIFQLTTTENQEVNEYDNISSINIGKCEDILKGAYDIDKNLPLIILKIDYFMEEFKIPVIGYEVFHPINKTKLNLKLCENETVDYNIPVDINEKELDKYNASSDYYNDDCSIYTTDDGTDIIILDRKKEYNENNMFLCENNCTYTNYNITSKKSVCMCKVKTKIYSISEIINNKNSISQSFNLTDNSTSSINLSLMKCIDTLFSKYGLLKNLENYIIIIMTMLYIGSSVLYYNVGSTLLENDIKEILDGVYENEKSTKKSHINQTGKRKTTKKKSNKSKKENMANPRKKMKISTNKSNSSNKNKNLIEYNKTIQMMNSTKDINIVNIKNTPDLKNNLNFNDFEINTLPYIEALVYDKRDLLHIYFSIIKRNHPIFFSFIPTQDYNTMIIKIDLFILKFAICSAINALFFTEKVIHRIYADKGSYNLGFYLPKIILSFLFTHIIIIVLKYIFLSERNILNIKNKKKYDEAYDEADKARRCLIIKYILFYVIGSLFLILFWYYLSSFCAVYQNTQIFLVINTFISLGISFLFPFIMNIVPSILRYISLKNSNNECIYKISKIIQLV